MSAFGWICCFSLRDNKFLDLRGAIMTTIYKPKMFQALLAALTLSAAACGNSAGGSKTNLETDGPTLAYILEKTATPTKWDTAGAEVVNFRHCVQRNVGDEAAVKATYQLHLDEIKFDLETIADAKANNYEVSSPPVKTHTASLLAACPAEAIATCDKGNLVEHYYTDAEWVLAGFETSCGYSGSDKWSVSK